MFQILIHIDNNYVTVQKVSVEIIFDNGRKRGKGLDYIIVQIY